MNASALVDLVNERIAESTTLFRKIKMSYGRIGESVNRPSRIITINTVRLIQSSDAFSFFYLSHPESLRNLSFLLREARGRVLPFEITLSLPYGSKSYIEVEDSRRFQDVISSDFSYDDLKAWHYLENQSFSIIEKNGGSLTIENTSDEKLATLQQCFKKKVITVNVKDYLISRIDFYNRKEDSSPTKIQKNEDYELVDGHFIQKRIQMVNLNANHETTLQLLDCKFNFWVDATLFRNADIRGLIQLINDA